MQCAMINENGDWLVGYGWSEMAWIAKLRSKKEDLLHGEVVIGIEV